MHIAFKKSFLFSINAEFKIKTVFGNCIALRLKFKVRVAAHIRDECISTQVRIYRRGSKAWTGNVFVDDLTIHAKKTLKMKFDKKDYKEVFCYKFTDETVKAKVKKIK